MEVERVALTERMMLGILLVSMEMGDSLSPKEVAKSRTFCCLFQGNVSAVRPTNAKLNKSDGVEIKKICLVGKIEAFI